MDNTDCQKAGVIPFRMNVVLAFDRKRVYFKGQRKNCSASGSVSPLPDVDGASKLKKRPKKCLQLGRIKLRLEAEGESATQRRTQSLAQQFYASFAQT
jgi:hypothetical protein